jgi:hypothetical protein
MPVTRRQALCCLLDSVEAVRAADPVLGVEEHEYRHRYPSTELTWPYCQHDAVVGRAIEPTTVPPAYLQLPESNDPQTTGRVWFDRFEIDVVRCGPPAPTGDGCLGDLYGDCSSPPSHGTLAGHHELLEIELEALRAQLLDRWCSCLVDLGAGYARHAPRWIETLARVTGGRFTANRIIVGTRLG